MRAALALLVIVIQFSDIAPFYSTVLPSYASLAFGSAEVANVGASFNFEVGLLAIEKYRTGILFRLA
jgi:hypothetical protein